MNLHIYPSVHDTKTADRLGIAHSPKAAAMFAVGCGIGTIVTPANSKRLCLAHIIGETTKDIDSITSLIEHRLQLRADGKRNE